MHFTQINTFPNHNPSGEKVQLNPCLYDRCILAMQFSRLIRNHTALHYFDADWVTACPVVQFMPRQPGTITIIIVEALHMQRMAQFQSVWAGKAMKAL